MADNYSIADIVETNVSNFATDADRWGSLARDTLTQIPDAGPDDPNIQPPTVSKPSELSYTKPVPEPIKPDTTIDDPAVPERYRLVDIASFYAPDQPSDQRVTFDWETGVPLPGSKPTLRDYTSPDVIVPEIDLPPEIVAPDSVTLVGVDTLPVLTRPTLPTLGVSINPATLPTLSNNFHYSENPYAPEMLDEILVQVRAVLGGRTLVPGWIWDAIWNRGIENLKRQEAAAVYEARSEMAALGWDMPGMPLFAREADARQKTHAAINDLTRENTNQQALMVREDFWKALETGMACEQLLLQADAQRKERLLKSAVEANNAGIAVYNAALQAYQITELASKELLLKVQDLQVRGVLAELEAFDRELKAAGFLLEYDKNQVELYKAQWEGEGTKAKAYQAYADAIRSHVEGQKAAVEAFGIQVKSNNDLLQGWAIEWEAYVKRLEPSRLKIQAHQARNALFANQLQAYQISGQQETARLTADIEIEKLGLAEAGQELERYKALWAGIQTKLNALTQIYATDGQVFAAKGQVESERMRTLIGQFQAEIQKAQMELLARVETAKTKLGYWQVEMDVWSKNQAAAAGVYSQLGAAAYSATNLSLGARSGYDVSYNHSEQKSHGYTVGIDVAVDDPSGLDLTPPI